MNNNNYAVYNEHYINPKNNIYYKIYNNVELFDDITVSDNTINENENNNNINNNVLAQGKQVILVDSDNPWYVNVSADKIPAKYKKIDFDKIQGFTGQKHTADFNSIIPENNQISLSSYSLKDRLNRLTQIEAFSNMNDNRIYYIVAFIILIIISYKYVKNK